MTLGNVKVAAVHAMKACRGLKAKSCTHYYPSRQLDAVITPRPI